MPHSQNRRNRKNRLTGRKKRLRREWQTGSDPGEPTNRNYRMGRNGSDPSGSTNRKLGYLEVTPHAPKCPEGETGSKTG